MATLTGKTIANTYKDLLQVSNENDGVDETMRTVSDGDGTNTALMLSNAGVNINGTFELNGEALTVNASAINNMADIGSATGIIAVNSGNVYGRTLTAGTPVSITNANGTAGNPTITLASIASVSGSYGPLTNFAVNDYGQIVSATAVSASVSIPTVRANELIAQTLTLSSNASIVGNLNADGTFVVDGIVSAGSDVAVGGSLYVTSNVSVTGNLKSDFLYAVSASVDDLRTGTLSFNEVSVSTFTVNQLAIVSAATLAGVDLGTKITALETSIGTTNTLIAATSAALATSIGNSNTNITTNINAITSINTVLAATSAALATSIGTANTRITSVSDFAVALSATMATSIANHLPLSGGTLSGSLSFSGANPNIIGGDTDGVFSITADTATDQGGNIKLYGNTHASKAQDIEFYGDSTVQLVYDDSASEWDFQANTVKTTTLAVSGNVSVTGNVSAAYYYGDGSNLTNLSTAPVSVSVYTVNQLTIVSAATLTGALESNSNITTTGDISGGTVNATSDTAAGDNAAIGYTATEGLILTGQGSTADLTVKNDADAVVFSVPTGTDDILFPDSAKAMFGDNSELSLWHDGGSNSIINDSSSGGLILRANNMYALNLAGTEYMWTAASNGGMTVYYDNTNQLSTTSAGVVINDTAAAAVDFRVESDTNANMLFVDGGNNNVGIGTGTPDSNHVLEIKAGNPEVGLISADDGAAMINFGDASARLRGRIYYSNASEYMKFAVNGNLDRFQIGSTEVVANEDGNAIDFRVESDGNANMLFVDAGNNRVGIGTASPLTHLYAGQDNIGGDVAMGIFQTGNAYGNTASSATIYLGATYPALANAAAITSYHSRGTTGNHVQDIAFLPVSTGSARFEAMRIDHAGYLGIGTATPSEILHIYDTGGSDAEIILETSTAGTGARMHLRANNQAGSRYNTISSEFGTTNVWRIGGTGSDNVIDFQIGSGFDTAASVKQAGFSIPDAKTIDISTPRLTGADHTCTGLTAQMLAGGTIAAFDLVCVHTTTAEVIEADASAYATARVIGIAPAAISDTATGTILLQGFIRDDSWSWTPGSTLYLSETAGAMTHTPPSTDGAFVNVVGVALTADVVYINPSMDVIERA